MYFVFVIKTWHKSVCRANSKITQNKLWKLFSFDYLNIRRNVVSWDAREEKNKEKDDGFLLLWGIFNKYIKEDIIMGELKVLNWLF